MAPVPRLVIVCADARSGTTALDSLLADAFRDLHVEGEVFYGVLSDLARRQLITGFPWADRSRDVAAEGLTGEALEQHAADYRETMGQHAVDVVETLLHHRERPTVIKLLRGQLPDGAVAEVLQVHRPHVIILRRPLLMTFASRSRANRSGRWRDQPYDPAQSTAFDPDEVRAYVAGSDAWHAGLMSLVDTLGLSSTLVTYEGLLESGADLVALRDVFAGLEWHPLSATAAEGWLPTTVAQDRRTDASVIDIAKALASLPADLQEDLTRLPALHPQDMTEGGGPG